MVISAVSTDGSRVYISGAGNQLYEWTVAPVGAVTGPEDKPKLVAVQNETVLRSGDRLKFFIEPKTGMSVYLFHQTADGELTVILPADGQGEKDVGACHELG